MTESFLISNLLDLLRASVTATVYLWVTCVIGRAISLRLGIEGSREVPQSFVLGAALLGFIWTLIAWIGWAYYPVVIIVTLLLTLLWFGSRHPRDPSEIHEASIVPGSWSPIAVAAAFATASFVFYAIIQCAANIRGGDLDIYHLVIPRSILWNHRFVLNLFSHDAGFSYGWQLYALPAFFVGGERSFVLMSAVAFVLLLLAIGKPIARRYGATTAWACVLVVSFVLSGVARESLTNNDIPLLLVEVVAIRLAFLSQRPAGLALDLAIGILCGFIVAIKPQGLASILLLGCWLLLRAGRKAPVSAAAFAAGFVPLAFLWPLINWLSYGSPLPQIMLMWPPSTGFLPQMRETMYVLMSNFGLWYRLNYLRLFSQGMEGWVLLLCTLPLLCLRPARQDPAIRLLLGFAVGRAVILTLLSKMDLAIVFHDRYHLISYVGVSLAAILGIYRTQGAREVPNWSWQSIICAVVILAATTRLWLTPVHILNPTGLPGPYRMETWPSIGSSAFKAAHSLAEPRGGGGFGIGSDWVSEFLPVDAIVATTAIDPYHLKRPFLQILPVSQNKIDLAGTPEEILASLRRAGATHLQLTEYSGLNLWMNPLIEKWLRSVRRIPEQPGVERLVWFSYPTDKGVQAIYRIAGSTKADPAGAEVSEPEGGDLARGTDGTWWVRWRPIFYGEIEVLAVPQNGRVSSLGGTRAEFGRYPIRMPMPKKFTIRLIHHINGKSSAGVDMQGVTP